MLLVKLLAGGGRYKPLCNCKDKSMSKLLVLVILEYLDQKRESRL